MEEPVKEQQPSAPASGSAGKSKLRYPLRSSMKSKEEKPPLGSLSTSSSRRGRASPSVSKSMGVLDLSREKSAKPTRRLSIPTKSNLTPSTKSLGTITPIPETRAKKSTDGQVKTDTPRSDVSRSATRRRFSVLSSISYWISQIRLSESVSKHYVSFGFFKLALEAGCGPVEKMHEELRSYIRRHKLDENEESIRELLQSYNVSVNSGQPQVSETYSHVPEEGARSSDDEVHSVSSVGSRKLKCKSLNIAGAQATSVADPAKQRTPNTNSDQPKVSRNCSQVPEVAGSSDDDVRTSSYVHSRKLKPKSLNTSAAAKASSVAQPAKESIRKSTPEARNRAMNKNISNSRAISDKGSQKLEKRAQKTTKPEPVKGKDKMGQDFKSTNEEGQISPTAAVKTVEEDKENMDVPLTEVIA